ncbi:MAG: hypothetical protein LBF72_03510 [Holosporales bacterium]|jgi:hypothetical protein|nr:hypothetical protein [Holosporales bacterium]
MSDTVTNLSPKDVFFIQLTCQVASLAAKYCYLNGWPLLHPTRIAFTVYASQDIPIDFVVLAFVLKCLGGAPVWARFLDNIKRIVDDRILDLLTEAPPQRSSIEQIYTFISTDEWEVLGAELQQKKIEITDSAEAVFFNPEAIQDVLQLINLIFNGFDPDEEQPLKHRIRGPFVSSDPLLPSDESDDRKGCCCSVY